VPSVSSPVQAGPELGQGRWFWLNVNAELVIYGSTDPDARVSINRRAIKLRPDGSFSYRFAFPDGAYSMAVSALAPDGAESRTAHLLFHRGSQHTGDVGAHPQDSGLKSPAEAELH
jgi:hypothetical protein